MHKVTIIPRGRALGVTMQPPETDRYSQDRERLMNMIAVLFGGRIAEELFMNQMTTGASNDFERATEIARRMVTQWGMSDELGPMVYGENEGEIFLGRSITTHKNVSEATMQKVDAEIRRIIDQQYRLRASSSRTTATRSRRWRRRCSSSRPSTPTRSATSWPASRRGRRSLKQHAVGAQTAGGRGRCRRGGGADARGLAQFAENLPPAVREILRSERAARWAW